MADFIDYYAELGVDPGISPDDLKTKWREFVLKNHPDKPGGDEITFKRGEAAHSKLKSPQERLRFDAEYRTYFNVADPAEAHRKERERTDAAWGIRASGGESDSTKAAQEKAAREARARARAAQEAADRAARAARDRARREAEDRQREDEVFNEWARTQGRSSEGAHETWDDLRAKWARRKAGREGGGTRDATGEDPTEDSEGKWSKAKEGAGNAWNKTKEGAGSQWDKAKEGAGKAKEGATKAGDKTKETTKDWARKTQEKVRERDARIQAEQDALITPANKERFDVSAQRRAEGNFPTPGWGIQNRK